MWIFTKHGFFSAVSARQGDGKHGEPVDIDCIMVRARIRGHLEALKQRSESEYKLLRQTIAHLILGLGGEDDKDTVARIKAYE